MASTAGFGNGPESGPGGAAPYESREDFTAQSIRTEFQKASQGIGRFNLAIFGKTGVGKSTLINAIFGKEIAATGIGRPVTPGRHFYLHETNRLGILDNRGLEIADEPGKLLAEFAAYLDEGRAKPIFEQIHVVWYCVAAPSGRFEDGEAAFVRGLADLGMPVILVLTQTRRKDGRLHPDHEKLADHIAGLALPIYQGRAYPVFAVADEFSAQDTYGLQELLDATFRLAPTVVEAAITAAQRVDMLRKNDAAQKAIALATTLAAGAGATPIPFSDAALLVPIQLAMMGKIAAIYDIELERAAIAALAATTAATQVGRSAAASLFKLIPVAGWVVGGAISASVASAITVAMGGAWHVICKRAYTGEIDLVALNSSALRDMFKKEVRRKLPGGSK